MTANVCGSRDGEDLSCSYYKLGVPTLGNYTDWVIHSMLSFSKSTDYPNGDGFINIWRNNVQLVSASNILTSYNQSEPPYMKFGSYVESWKVASDPSSLGINWASVTYKSLRLGNQGSSYDEVSTLQIGFYAFFILVYQGNSFFVVLPFLGVHWHWCTLWVTL